MGEGEGVTCVITLLYLLNNDMSTCEKRLIMYRMCYCTALYCSTGMPRLCYRCERTCAYLLILLKLLSRNLR